MSAQNRPLIYTVGDSHAIHGWLLVPGIVAESRGPMLMHTYRNAKGFLDGIPPGSIVIFCWGEIDCRCHVHKFQPWEKTVDELAARYLEEISHIANEYEIWLYNVVPPPHQDRVEHSVGFPFLGTDEERLAYVQRLNLRLKESGFVFIDVYDQYADKDGFLRPEMSDSHVHIKGPQPLIDWLERRFNGPDASAR